jgi:hypothetical protein
MSVMTPDQLRQGRNLPPIQTQPGMQTQALIDQMAPQQPAAAPVATNPGTFSRGGQVKQLPGMGADVTNKLVSTGAGVAATAAGTMNPVTIGTEYLGKKLKPKEEMPTFGGEFGGITDDYGRRFEGAGPGVKGGAVRGAGYGAMAGPVGAGVGAAIGAIAGAATKNATSAFSDFRVEDAADALQKGYQQYLGRPASEEEIQNALVGQGWNPTGGDRWVGEKGLFSVLGQIRDSPEAQAFKTTGVAGGQQAAAPSMQDVAAAIAGESAPSAAAASAAPAAAGGKMGGFDGAKLGGASDSPKYQVGRILQKYPSTPAGLQQALGEIQALGLADEVSITGSKGDKLRFAGNTDPRFNGITEFDVIKGAGNGGEEWQWIDPNDAGGAAGGDAAMLAALTGGGGSAAAPAAGGDASSLPGVMAAIQKLLASQGQSSQQGYTDALLREMSATA